MLSSHISKQNIDEALQPIKGIFHSFFGAYKSQVGLKNVLHVVRFASGSQNIYSNMLPIQICLLALLPCRAVSLNDTFPEGDSKIGLYLGRGITSQLFGLNLGAVKIFTVYTAYLKNTIRLPHLPLL